MEKAAEVLRVSASRLLNREPVGASLEAIEIWKNLKPLNSQVFDDFAAKASDETLKLDLLDVELKGEESGVHCFMMEQKKT